LDVKSLDVVSLDIKLSFPVRFGRSKSRGSISSKREQSRKGQGRRDGCSDELRARGTAATGDRGKRSRRSAMADRGPDRGGRTGDGNAACRADAPRRASREPRRRPTCRARANLGRLAGPATERARPPESPP